MTPSFPRDGVSGKPGGIQTSCLRGDLDVNRSRLSLWRIAGCLTATAVFIAGCTSSTAEAPTGSSGSGSSVMASPSVADVSTSPSPSAASSVVTTPPEPATTEASASPDPAAREATDRAAIETQWVAFWDVYNGIVRTPSEQRQRALESVAVDPILSEIVDAAARFDSQRLDYYGSVVQ